MRFCGSDGERPAAGSALPDDGGRFAPRGAGGVPPVFADGSAAGGGVEQDDLEGEQFFVFQRFTAFHRRVDAEGGQRNRAVHSRPAVEGVVVGMAVEPSFHLGMSGNEPLGGPDFAHRALRAPRAAGVAQEVLEAGVRVEAVVSVGVDEALGLGLGIHVGEEEAGQRSGRGGEGAVEPCAGGSVEPQAGEYEADAFAFDDVVRLVGREVERPGRARCAGAYPVVVDRCRACGVARRGERAYEARGVGDVVVAGQDQQLGHPGREPLCGKLPPRLGGGLYAALHAVGHVAAADHEVERVHRLSGPDPAVAGEHRAGQFTYGVGHGVAHFGARGPPAAEVACHAVVEVGGECEANPALCVQRVGAQQQDGGEEELQWLSCHVSFVFSGAGGKGRAGLLHSLGGVVKFVFRGRGGAVRPAGAPPG